MRTCDHPECQNNSRGLCRISAPVTTASQCEFYINTGNELTPQMIIHDLTALKVNKLPAMQRSIDAAIQIIKCKRDAQ